MGSYTQTDRPLKITTPLGPDILLLREFRGHEEISRLFGFHVEMAADLKDDVRFDQIIGQSVTVEMRLLDDSKRYFNGIVNRFSQHQRDENFLYFRADIVPKFWLLSKKVRSRVFQHLSVPDILKQVLVGFDVSYDITGTYYQRDYVVQYRESDFAFASRLMEEEGIYYFFIHSDGNHQMMVSDNTSKHPAVPGQSSAIYEEVFGEVRTDMRVIAWEKTQELRSGECTLWDYTFELPTNHLEAKEKTIVPVPVGKVVHKLNLANDSLEIYDYPGRYAQRFDGIDPSGGDRPADIAHTFADRMRTVRLRMEQEEVLGIRIEGKSDCGNFTAGHKFTLQRHFDADASYLLMRVEHEAVDESYRSDQPDTGAFTYENRFTCIPETLRYRPQRVDRGAGDRGHADGHRGRPPGRRNLGRQVWPGEDSVSLGPRRENERRQFLLGARSPGVGWQRLGRILLAPHRNGGCGELRRGRSRPATHRRMRVQCGQHAPVHAPFAEEDRRHQIEERERHTEEEFQWRCVLRRGRP